MARDSLKDLKEVSFKRLHFDRVSPKKRVLRVSFLRHVMLPLVIFNSPSLGRGISIVKSPL